MFARSRGPDGRTRRSFASVAAHAAGLCSTASGGNFVLQAVSAESPQLAASVRAQHDKRGMQFTSDLGVRALNAGEPITVSIDPTTYALGDLIPSGVLIAAPYRSSHSQGAVLIYPRREGSFTDADKALVAAVVGFGAVALAHAEIHAVGDENTEDVQRLLDFVSELNAIEQPDLLMQKLTVRCAEYLGFNASCIAVKEAGNFHLRWKAESGRAELLDLRLPFHSGIARPLLNKEVFWTPESKASGSEIKKAADLELRQLLAVPLLAKDGSVLGMLALLDRIDGAVTQNDVLRTRQIATHVASAMERFSLFARMEQANHQWVEIFDAISDFIVVHDQNGKVQRVNRSLADFIGVSPAALIGVEMAALFDAADPATVRDCPFCRATDHSGEEYLHSIMEHTYRVSSSRTTNRDGVQTIHVLRMLPTAMRLSAVIVNSSATSRRACFSPRQMGVSWKSTMPWCTCSVIPAGKNYCKPTFAVMCMCQKRDITLSP